MKLMGLAVPSFLAATFKQLIATGAPNGAGMRVARTTKKATHTTNKKAKRPQAQDYENAVDNLIAYLTKKNGAAPAEGFRAAQIAAIKKAEFDPLYWVKCAQDSQQVFSNVPSSAPFSGGRAYAYPDPANLPSLATYGGGTEASGALVYHGATVGGMFKDLGLTWQRSIFTLANKMQSGIAEPLFLKLTGSINGTANARATRTLLSVVIKRWMVTSSSARLTTNEPPTTEAIQALYRYVTPRGVSPFFNLSNPLRLMYNMRGAKYEEPTGDLTKCVVLVAPMPLMGYRNNNNTAASSTLTATLELWQVLKAQGVELAGMSPSRVDQDIYSIAYGKPMQAGFKFYRRTSTGDSDEITPPWIADTLLYQIHAEGDYWVFLTDTPERSGQPTRYNFNRTDGLFSNPIDDFMSQYLSASNPWNTACIFDFDGTLTWQDTGNAYSYFWEIYAFTTPPQVTAQGVGFSAAFQDGESWFFIPWATASADLDSGGVAPFVVSGATVPDVPDETLWTNQGDNFK